MNQTLGSHHLKVDQTVLPLQNNFYLLVSNINIPERFIDQVQPILGRIVQFISNDYGNATPSIDYQLTASYTLRNTNTGELRTWTGSFYPTGNDRACITPFRTYNSNFIANVSLDLQRQNIFNKLQFNQLDSAWKFESLISIIINVQAKITHNHHVFFSKRHFANYQRRRKRSHLTFHLP